MNQHHSTEPAWKASVAVTDVPETGQHIELVADEAVRAGIAKIADLVALPRLEAEFDLSRQGPDGLHVTGRVKAKVVQNCVVTLDPVDSELDEPIDLVFMPPQDA